MELFISGCKQKTKKPRLKILFSASVFFLCLALFLFTARSVDKTYAAESEDIIYAYLPGDITLYKENPERSFSESNRMTTLPKTYFVALLEDYGENSQGYIRASYLDLTGYVKKSEIQPVDYEPKTKYALGALKLDNDLQKITLRSEPDNSKDGNVLTSVDSGTTAYYYGALDGAVQESPYGSKWYFIKIDEGAPYTAYVYNRYVTAEPIKNNIIEKIEKPVNIPPGGETENPAFNMSPLKTALFIIGLSAPAAVIMLLLFSKPSSKKRSPRSF